MIDIIRRSMPHIKFILPTAPAIPVTINHGMRMPAWYDISHLADRDEDFTEGIDDTKAKVTKIIEDEIKSGIPSNRIILGGFSQGGACSLYIGYTFAKPLAGILGLSCYLPQGEYVSKNYNPACIKYTDLLMCHGEGDTVVYHDWGKKSFQKLKALGVSGNFLSYSNLDHGPNDQMISDYTTWIQKVLAPITTSSKL